MSREWGGKITLSPGPVQYKFANCKIARTNFELRSWVCLSAGNHETTMNKKIYPPFEITKQADRFAKNKILFLLFRLKYYPSFTGRKRLIRATDLQRKIIKI